MNKLYLLERVFTGRKVKFFVGTITEGPKKDNKVMILHDIEKNKNFVIGASIYSFVRFKRWDGKEAFADYDPKLKSVVTDHGRLNLITLSTEVELDDFKERKMRNFEYDFDF